MKEKARIMDAQAMGRAVQRIGYEIVERNKGTENVVLIGIQRRGVPLSQRIAGHIERVEGVTVPVGCLDITFYRDDLSLLSEHPVLNGTDIPFVITGRDVVLVDVVLPILAPTMLPCALLAFVRSLSDYGTPVVIGGSWPS